MKSDVLEKRKSNTIRETLFECE